MLVVDLASSAAEHLGQAASLHRSLLLDLLLALFHYRLSTGRYFGHFHLVHGESVGILTLSRPDFRVFARSCSGYGSVYSIEITHPTLSTPWLEVFRLLSLQDDIFDSHMSWCPLFALLFLAPRWILCAIKEVRWNIRIELKGIPCLWQVLTCRSLYQRTFATIGHVFLSVLRLQYGFFDFLCLPCVLGIEVQIHCLQSLRSSTKRRCSWGWTLFCVFSLFEEGLSWLMEELCKVLWTQFLLLWELLCDIRVPYQLRYTLPVVLVMLQTLGQKGNSLERKTLFHCLFEAIVTCLNFTFEFLSVPRVERGLSVDQLEEDYPERPNVWFIGILTFLNNLRSHIKRGSADSLIDLTLVLEFLRKPKVSDLNSKVDLVHVDFPEKLLFLFSTHV